MRRRGNPLLSREEGQELAHVVDAELARMSAAEMNDEAPNPVYVRRNSSFAEATLTPTTPYLPEKPMSTFGIGWAEQLCTRDQHRAKLPPEMIPVTIILPPGKAASSQFLAPGAPGK